MTNATTPVSAKESFMDPKVGQGRPYLHPRQPLSRKCRVAADLNISPASADKLLYGERAVNLLYAAVIESDLRAGDNSAVAMWEAPAQAALSGMDVPDLMAAFAEYDAADAVEDVEQVALNHKCLALMTDHELNTYGRSVARELYAGARFLAALRKVQRDRKAAAK